MVKLDSVTAAALVPDQLLPYVRAVSGLESSLLGQCVFHSGGDQGVLVAFPIHDAQNRAAAEESLQLAKKIPDLKELSVLAPFRLAEMENVREDTYWQLSLPPPPPQVKLRNMLNRARREISIVKSSGASAWTEEHEAVTMDFCRRKQAALGDGNTWLFSHLKNYLAQAEGTMLFSAYTSDGTLTALAIGDFSALATAFYMFACRRENSPPGSADALLNAIASEASLRGHMRLNLGLGIDPGIEFFKKKWGATPYLPLVEGTVPLSQTKKSGFWAKLWG